MYEKLFNKNSKSNEEDFNLIFLQIDKSGDGKVDLKELHTFFFDYAT